MKARTYKDYDSIIFLVYSILDWNIAKVHILGV